MKYRKEIDGLRGLAVLLVMFFHGGLLGITGGYVGVDVFFVISGYLITTILLEKNVEGSFSLLEFYERRARRILPALFLVMGVSAIAAWIWLFPRDLKDFSQSLVAVSLFTSNIFFWLESGYWGVENEVKPLLHTWSLAVEEQFYLLFPLFLMLIWRLRRAWLVHAFILVSLISLAVSQWGSASYPVLSFFMFPTRAWELLIGAVIAAHLFFYRTEFSRGQREMGALLGMSMISASAFLFDKNTVFPGVNALLPTLGTALILFFADSKTRVVGILRWKPVVFIGLISYSAYLWHQPLFAFVRQLSVGRLSVEVFFILLLVSLAFAYLSWRFVEQPFRDKGKVSGTIFFRFSLVGMMFFLGIGIFGHLTRGELGIASGFSSNLLAVNEGLGSDCDKPDQKVCMTEPNPEILIWGDSYAMHLVKGMLASKEGLRVAQITRPVCGPFIDIAPVTRDYPVSWARRCLEMNRQALEWMKGQGSLRYVVLSSSFGQYMTEGKQLLFNDGRLEKAGPGLAEKEFRRTLRRLEAMGLVPVIFSPTPGTREHRGRCLANAIRFGVELSVCDYSIWEISHDMRVVYDTLKNLAGDYKIVWLNQLLCQDSQCRAHMDGVPLYIDGGHLSIVGSMYIGRKFDFYSLVTGGRYTRTRAGEGET